MTHAAPAPSCGVKQGKTSLWLDDDDMPSNADWNALLTTSAGQAVLHEALARADLASPLSCRCLPCWRNCSHACACLNMTCSCCATWRRCIFRMISNPCWSWRIADISGNARPAQFLACALDVKMMVADSWLQDERQSLARCGWWNRPTGIRLGFGRNAGIEQCRQAGVFWRNSMCG